MGGLTPNAALAALPEAAQITLATDGTKPVPGVLQLPLRETIRVSFEKALQDTIGQGALLAALTHTFD